MDTERQHCRMAAAADVGRSKAAQQDTLHKWGYKTYLGDVQAFGNTKIEVLGTFFATVPGAHIRGCVVVANSYLLV